jgi:Colicin V production protein.
MSADSLNWIDYTVIGCTIWAIFNGIKRGVVSALIAVLGIAVGYILVRWIGVPIALWISETLSLPHGVAVIGVYIATFSLSCWGVAFLARPAVRSIRRSSLSVVNRLLGALFTGSFVILFFSLIFNLTDHILPRDILSQLPTLPTDTETTVEQRRDIRDTSRLYDPIKGLIHNSSLGDLAYWQDKQLKQEASE